MQERQAAPQAIRTFFTPPVEQVDMVKRWNKDRGWGFTPAEFEQVSAGPASRRRGGRLSADVLSVSLEGSARDPGYVRTFNELAEIAFAPFIGGWCCWDGFERLTTKTLRPAGGTQYSGKLLRWVTIDLGADRNKPPARLSTSVPRPGLSVLAAAALHPHWLEAMDGRTVPYVWLAGLDLSLSTAKPWNAKPRLGFCNPLGEVRMHAIESDRHHPCWAVPSYVRP